MWPGRLTRGRWARSTACVLLVRARLMPRRRYCRTLSAPTSATGCGKTSRSTWRRRGSSEPQLAPRSTWTSYRSEYSRAPIAHHDERDDRSKPAGVPQDIFRADESATESQARAASSAGSDPYLSTDTIHVLADVLRRFSAIGRAAPAAWAG